MTTSLVVADRVRTARDILGDALLLRDGRIAAIGRLDDLRRADIPVEHFRGGVIIPGMRDAHMHPLPYTLTLTRPTLKDAADLDELLWRVRMTAAEMPAGQPLIAIRLDDETLSEGRLPTRRDLDLAVDDRPLLVYRYCGHVAVANTLALQAAGIGSVAADPVGGTLDRDDFGIPNGILRETAIEPVASALHDLTAGPDPETVLEALHGLVSLGLTSLGAILAVGTGPWCDAGNELQAVLAISERLPLKLAVLVIAADSAELEHAALALEEAGPRLRFLGVKEFADGSLGGHTAALGSPYSDRPDTRGTLRLDPGAETRARTALRLGGKVAVHAIGDVANARVLDLFDELLADGARPVDLRVEHASILDRELVSRFAGSGVTASVQPAFMASEAGWLQKRLGAERLAHAYPLASLSSAGVPLAGGSDCPVEPPHPLWGMAAARDRAGLAPQQESLSGALALALFTDGAARALGEPEPLAVGSPADFVVLDCDPVEASPPELREARVLATWIDGEAGSLRHEAITWRG